jgi:ketosteroid isomerase-like protein
MPWFPEYVSAIELARRETRVAGQADPITQYLTSVTRGDTGAVEDVWPGQVVVYDPHAGEVRGHRQLRRFVRDSRAALAQRRARIDTATSIVAGNRAVVELMVHLGGEEKDLEWPVAIVAESPDDRSVVFRSYFNRRALDGLPHVRSSFLSPGQVRPGDIVGRHQAALAASDAYAVARTFEPDGCYREAIDPHRTHRGTAELRAYFQKCFDAGGGIDLQPCAVTDDSRLCAVEYNCERPQSQDMPPQAGIAIYERGPDRLLASARVYDDVEP